MDHELYLALVQLNQKLDQIIQLLNEQEMEEETIEGETPEEEETRLLKKAGWTDEQLQKRQEDIKRTEDKYGKKPNKYPMKAI